MALSDLTADQWLVRLLAKKIANYAAQKRLWLYYDNDQPLAFVAKILHEQGDRFPPLLVNWSALVVDALEERLDVLGFRDPEADKVDDRLQQWWQENNLDELSGEAHTCSMVARESYVMLGPVPAGRETPATTIEYPDQVVVEIDPLTRQVVAALKVWQSDPALGHADMATLQIPGKVITYEQGKQVEQTADHGWAERALTEQTSPLVPVFPMNNRQRRGVGYTELKSLLPVVDAVNQLATNMLAAIEHHALPRRWGIGVDPRDFKDEAGNALKAWQIATGALWAIPPATDDDGNPLPSAESERPQVGQFTGADLTNFHNSIKQVAMIAASLYGLPPHYMGYSSENPASADAIRSSEARLVKRAERHQRGKGGTWEGAGRCALHMMDEDPNRIQPADENGDRPERSGRGTRMETWWRDPSTPTSASQADRAVKLKTAGIIDEVQALEDCGYTPGQIRRILDRRARTGANIGDIVGNVRQLNVGAGRSATNQDPAVPPAIEPGPAGQPALNGAATGSGR